jgi:hypothetical protein
MEKPITKEDFLTASKLAKKLGYDTKIITAAMTFMQRKNIQVKLSNQQLRPAVIGKIPQRKGRLYPGAEPLLLKTIESMKAKEV